MGRFLMRLQKSNIYEIHIYEVHIIHIDEISKLMKSQSSYFYEIPK